MGINDFHGKSIGGCCRECTERYEACHDHCEKYQKAIEEWKEHKRRIKEALKPNEYDEHKFSSIKAMERRRKYGRKS